MIRYFRLLAAAVIFAACSLTGHVSAPQVHYSDPFGADHAFPNPDKVAVVGFWITDCAYSARVIRIINGIKQDSDDSKVETLVFFLNQTDNQTIQNDAQQMEIAVPYAAAQPPTELIAALQDGFHIRGPGRDIYIVDRKGRMLSVDTSDLSAPEDALADAVRKELQRALKS